MSDHEDDDDDIYGTAEPAAVAKREEAESSGGEPMDDADSGDDSDDSESDLEIIIDKPMPAAKSAVQQQPQESRAIKIEAPPQTSQLPPQAPKTLATGSVPQLSVAPGTAYPALKTSSVDVNGDPVYPPQNKTLLQVDMDADLAEEQKIWRRPGEDQSDYFNYGFDEFTWEIYRQRQITMANTLQTQKNDMAQMQQMMGGGPMPGMPTPAANNAPVNAPAGPAGPGGAMNEEQQMQMMFSQMANQGMDLSNMDFNSFIQMAGGFPGGPGPQQGGYSQANHGGGGRGRGRGRGW